MIKLIISFLFVIWEGSFRLGMKTVCCKNWISSQERWFHVRGYFACYCEFCIKNMGFFCVEKKEIIYILKFPFQNQGAYYTFANTINVSKIEKKKRKKKKKEKKKERKTVPITGLFNYFICIELCFFLSFYL